MLRAPSVLRRVRSLRGFFVLLALGAVALPALIAGGPAIASLRTLIVALAFVVLGAVIAALRSELERERAAGKALQSAAAGRLVAPAHLAVGTAYRSATPGASVGGDLYDVFPIDACRTLLLIADVSGKGVSAAIDTTFVRYSVRALACERLFPAAIVARFDELYRASSSDPQGFVALFVAVHDRARATLTYANAGHGAAWIRRRTEIVPLSPSGPIVGIGGFPFSESTRPFTSDDVLILATDGLTEARDPAGSLVSSARVERWLTQSESASAQRLADILAATVTAYTRGRISDDLAILTVCSAAVPERVCRRLSLAGAVAG